MASAIGTALFSTILQPMAAKAMEKVDGIVNIKRDISNLQKTLGMIQSIVQVAEEKQIDDDVIRNLLRDLVDIGYEARDVLDDFITSSSCTITAEEASNPVNTICSLMLSCFGVLSNDTSNIPLTVLNQLEKDIRTVKERFEGKIKESEKFNTLRSVVGGGGSESISVDRRPEVGPYINEQRHDLFLGREKVKEEIMDKILRPSYDCVDVVVISGMGGIGKTFLAQSIYNDKKVKKVPRSWLSVGVSKFSAKKVMRNIVSDKESTGTENLQTKLKEKFKGNRFLIVLDDVWNVDDIGSEWDLLFNPLTRVGEGGLIIITTRERQFCDKITIQTPYNLETLSEEDSWSIFERCAYVNGKSDNTPDLKDIGKLIVKKLNGLPLALKVVGRSLLNKDSSTWKKFLESKLTKDGEVMSSLRWSYNHLPRHLKTCFTYCSLFPKHHEFDKKVLVQMWMAHDLIEKEKLEKERPEDVGAQYFEQLVNASLLQCVDGKHVMHDLIHDLALLVSNEEFANNSLTNEKMETVRHVTITPDDYSKVPRLCKMEKLLTLYATHANIYPHETPVLDDVFKQLKSIRVLVLCGKGIKEIPHGISELKHLRYLDVSKTSVQSLPDSLCYLYHLQTLAAPLDAVLPGNIVNMVNLRYVIANLSTCKEVGKLTSLQELSSIHVREGDNIRELGDMQILRGKLTIKGLENVTSKEDAAGALMKNQTLMDELLLVFNQQFAEPNISEEVLDALGCPPNLTYLRIAGYNGLKPPSWMVDGKHKFDKLELYDCSKLESLPPLGELTSLKHLSLVNVGVKRLGKEFYGNLTKEKVFFPSLESLSFSKMNEWEEWNDIIIENSTVSFFPLLTRLEIHRCPKLRIVLPPDLHNLSSLERLSINDCPELQSLPPDFHKLSSLERLSITHCRQLHSVPPGFGELSSLKMLDIISCSKLQSLYFHKLSSLKKLRIICCQELQSLPPSFGELSSLKKLKIISCPRLQSLPADGFYPSLRRLTIENCQLLYERCQEKSGLDWCKIHKIRRKKILVSLCDRCRDRFGSD